MRHLLRSRAPAHARLLKKAAVQRAVNSNSNAQSTGADAGTSRGATGPKKRKVAARAPPAAQAAHAPTSDMDKADSQEDVNSSRTQRMKTVYLYPLRLRLRTAAAAAAAAATLLTFRVTGRRCWTPTERKRTRTDTLLVQERVLQSSAYFYS